MFNKKSSTHSLFAVDEFLHTHKGLGEKDANLSFFKPVFDIEEFKKNKELDSFRKSRRNFFRFVFLILGVHSVVTFLLLAVIPLAISGHIDINLNIIIPSYFINIAVQVFALMKAVVKYFDKGDFIQK